MKQIISLVFVFSFCIIPALSKHRACKSNEKHCGVHCYDPTNEGLICLDDFQVCAKTQQLCGDEHHKVCYSPETDNCLNGNICPKGHELCGKWLCYDPAVEHCTDSLRTCPIGKVECGLFGCYSPEEEICVKQTHDSVVCLKGQITCGVNCYSPDSGAKCYDDDVLCEAGQDKCGYLCYNPKNEKCFHDSLPCLNEQEPCGEYHCYSPNNETCSSFGDEYGMVACPKNEKPCGINECFNPEDKECLEVLHGLTNVCSKGSEICGFECHDLGSGGKCVADGEDCTDLKLCGKVEHN